ncbi:hypothetical protein D5F01_LYC23987 [Larimichthys crocea]|uniref:Uncharacterized protein n=1 Tax=Larimichthys crocea TaxID=215358 RepID=A0A6G0HFI5_LARCR|nr:hypothetical protein D5F01_LYC23987 [Larimichthys crocea]
MGGAAAIAAQGALCPTCGSCGPMPKMGNLRPRVNISEVQGGGLNFVVHSPGTSPDPRVRSPPQPPAEDSTDVGNNPPSARQPELLLNTGANGDLATDPPVVEGFDAQEAHLPLADFDTRWDLLRLVQLPNVVEARVGIIGMGMADNGGVDSTPCGSDASGPSRAMGVKTNVYLFELLSRNELSSPVLPLYTLLGLRPFRKSWLSHSRPPINSPEGRGKEGEGQSKRMEDENQK